MTSVLLAHPSIFSISLLCLPFILSISLDEKDANPRASLLLLSSAIITFSPLLNLPEIDLMPAANKLFPFFKAIDAPLSIKIVPLELRELTIHFFLASKVDIFGINLVNIFFFYHMFNWIYFISITNKHIATSIHTDTGRLKFSNHSTRTITINFCIC